MPFIITVHDLIRYFDLMGYNESTRYHPLIHSPNSRDRAYLKLDYKGIKKAARIIAASHTTKRDLVKHLSIPGEQISVVYHGLDHDLFSPGASPAPLNNPYLLFVGAEHPRKNLPTLLAAFKILKIDAQFKDLKLVKVGKAGGREANFRKATQEVIEQLGLREEIIFCEFVPEEALVAYYRGAECLVFPSFYEGFGLPVIEAMACGCPVITSNTTALPEVAGEAAIHIDPHDPAALAAALRQLLTQADLRKELVEKGLERAAYFSWEKVRKEPIQVYREVEASTA